MTEYHKIPTVWKRDPARPYHTLLGPGGWLAAVLALLVLAAAALARWPLLAPTRWWTS